VEEEEEEEEQRIWCEAAVSEDRGRLKRAEIDEE